MKKLLLIAAALLAANLLRAQWEPDVRLTNDPAMTMPPWNNSRLIVTSGDTLHVVWYDMRDGNYEIYYKRSTDGGINWEADTRLTNNAALSSDPCIAVSGNIVHVTWMDDRNTGNREIYYKRSEDGGSTWGADTRLTNAIHSSEYSSIAISGSVLHVAWYDKRDDPTGNGDGEIYYKRSTDGGLTWENDTRLTVKSGYAGFPCIVASGSLVHIAWEDARNGNGNIYYKRSTDGGLTWGADIQLTNDPADQWDPCLALSDSVIHVVWQDNRNGSNNYEIYYKCSADAGVTWGQDTRLSTAAGNSLYPTIAVSGSLVHIVWEDDRYNGMLKIFYKQSVNAGISWGEETQLTNASGNSYTPFIALSDSVVHIAWDDDRDGNYEIYYKRNPTGNVPVGIGNVPASSSEQQYRIYPNPASTIIHIYRINNSNDKAIFTIWNILGEKLSSRQLQDQETVMDVSAFQPGLYFVGIATENRHSPITKLIIQR